MRSLLFTPGVSAKMMAKAVDGAADVVILDLEDSVSPDGKAAAREAVVAILARPRRAGSSLYVRINPLDSAWCGDDLRAVLPGRPDGIMLPKPDGPEDVVRLSQHLAELEQPDMAERTRIIAICTETAAGTLSLAAQSWRHPRLSGLVWGGEDLAAVLGATSNRDAAGQYTGPFALARNLCLLAARAAGVTPIDAVYTDFRNPEGLAAEVAAARRDGFDAKAAIHPSQIDIINRAFSYTDAERDWARRVVAALKDGAIGAAQMDGSMVDVPHLVQARRILSRSR
ncbi:CoA ester lyase [Ferrovibrio sp.]|uniref:HpcH/HpaI aldolase/citrate lyase family protein n=1 Tax=Ferrovibrio sp. TaxID=1917215 RepID=UPI000CC00CAC|nr:CoA ester lyase [Ferrovibrio sp.]PJI40930.1 MAG: CoA ester lyase [Ferrovibrio sp.]